MTTIVHLKKRRRRVSRDRHFGMLILLPLLCIVASYKSVATAREASQNIRTLCFPKTGYRNIQVDGPSRLSAALASAKPGDRISIAPGEYPGKFELRASGTGNLPIIVTSNGPKPVFTGSIRVLGDFVVLSGLKFQSGSVFVAGDHVRVTRNVFRGEGAYAIATGDGGSYDRIDHNDISFIGHGIQIHLSGLSPRLMRTTGIRIDHNYIHDVTGKHGNGYEGIQIGQSPKSAKWHVGALIDHNLLDKVEIDSEMISIKAGWNTIAYNTFSNSRATVSNRQGSHNSFRYNYLDNVANGMSIWGDDTEVLGNTLTSGNIDVFGGNGTLDAEVKGGFPTARRTVLNGNTMRKGKIRLGFALNGHDWNAPEDTVVGDDQGTVDAIKQVRMRKSPMNRLQDAAKELTTADVGPGAADDDCR